MRTYLWDTDGTLLEEKKLQSTKVGIIPYPHSSLGLEERFFAQALALAPSPPQLSFLGSGNYHFLTYFLLQKIEQPFILVLVDNHMDYGEESGSILHCGNWLRWALGLPLLENVSVVGATVRIENPRLLSWEKARETSAPLYLSLDKDVLSPEELELSWEQGNWTRQDLRNFLHDLPQNRLLGADICGEPRSSPDDFSLQVTKSLRISESINLEIWNILAA